MFRFVFLITSLFLMAFVSGREVSHAPEVLKVWDKEQHLYTKGELPLSDTSLKQLEDWLDRNAKNWTIVLLRSARGESWVNPQGHSYAGMDAVENVLGRGLGNHPEFSSQLDSISQSRNGAVFVLFLEERKFSYFGSDVYDRYGLGEANWRGDLDAPAIRAMRGGGRIIDAVKDTVRSIDQKLARAQERERVRAIQREQTMAHALKASHSRIAKVRGLIELLEHEVKPMVDNPTTARGDLARPEFHYWESSLANVESALRRKDADYAQRLSQKVESEVELHRERVRDWAADIELLEELSLTLDEAQVAQQNPTGMTLKAEALAQLEVARQQHAKANVAYRMHLEAAQASLRSLVRNNQRIEQNHAMLVKQGAERARLKKRAGIAGIAGVVLSLLSFGIYSHRRRRGVKAQAEKAIELWRAAIRQRVDRLFKSLDRATLVIGTESDLLEQKVSGRTREESIKAIRGVDYLFVLSANVEHVLDSAESLVYPSSLFSKLINLFSSRRFDAAIELLERKEIQNVASARKVMGRSDKELLGVAECAQKFSFTFPKLIKHYDKTLRSAEARIELVHQAWTTISERTKALSDLLDKVEGFETDVCGFAIRDTWMDCGVLYESWLVQARRLHRQALEFSATDPQHAIEKPLPLADVMAMEMLEVLGVVFEFRRDSLPHIVEQMRQMQRQRRGSTWVNEALEVLSDQLVRLSERGSQASVVQEIEEWKMVIQHQLARFQLCVVVIDALGNAFSSDRSALVKSIADARRELGDKLNLPSSQLLCESEELNPSARADLAQSYREKALACIDSGEIQAADSLRSQAFGLLDEATSIVAQTRDAYAGFTERVSGGKRLLTRGESEFSEMKGILKGLAERYSTHALRQHVETEHSESILDLEADARSLLDRASESLREAEIEQANARILTARDLLSGVESCVSQHRVIHSMVLGRKEVLAALEQSNEEVLEQMRHSHGNEQVNANAHSTQVSTQQLYKSLLCELERASEMIQSEVRSPFVLCELLVSLEDGLEDLSNAIESDLRAHESVVELEGNTRKLMESTEALVHRSRTDQIPDSPLTQDCIEAVSEHTIELAKISGDLKRPHSEWAELAQQLHGLTEKLINTHQLLVGDLKKADYAMHSIIAGRNDVRRVLGWSGRYGVRAVGADAQSYLRAAENALFRGDYTAATNSAGAATRAAVHAISRAEAEVAQIRRRRAQERRRNSSSSFGVSVGSSSFGRRSSFGSGSSSSSSSFSSGSGFGRSGW